MLGSKLKKARVDKDLSMDALSRIFQNEYGLNVTKSMISRWENGLAEPTNKYVSAYAKYFGLDMNDLLDIPASRVKESVGYYADPEVAALAEEARTNPQIRVLLSASKNLSKSELDQTIKFIKFLRSQEKNDSDFSE